MPNKCRIHDLELPDGVEQCPVCRIVEVDLDLIEVIAHIKQQLRDVDRQYVILHKNQRHKNRALQAVLDWSETDIVSEKGTIGYFAEEVVPLVEEALNAGQDTS